MVRKNFVVEERADVGSASRKPSLDVAPKPKSRGLVRRAEVTVLLGTVFLAPAYSEPPRSGPSEKDIRFIERSELRSDVRNYAVVVGIDSYAHGGVPNLNYAVKDAKDVASVLNECKWKVSTMTSDQDDAKLRPDTAVGIEARIREYAAATKEHDTILFYFSGHGFVDEQENGFLCPSQVDPTPERLAESGLSISRVKEALASGKAQKQILILDACRNVPGKTLITGAFTEEMLRASKGLGVLYATSPGSRSFEPTTGLRDLTGRPIENGLFTHFLLRGLRGDARINDDEFLTFHELAYWVGSAMNEFVLEDEMRQFGEQKPWKHWDGGMTDDVLIREIGPKPGVSAEPDSDPVTPPANAGRSEASTNPKVSKELSDAIALIRSGATASELEKKVKPKLEAISKTLDRTKKDEKLIATAFLARAFDMMIQGAPAGRRETVAAQWGWDLMRRVHGGFDEAKLEHDVIYDGVSMRAMCVYYDVILATEGSKVSKPMRDQLAQRAMKAQIVLESERFKSAKDFSGKTFVELMYERFEKLSKK